MTRTLKRTLILVALVLPGADTVGAAELPAGTPLSIRLTTRVSSHKSRRGDAVRAVLIAPVELAGLVALPAGETLRGTVREVDEQNGRASLRVDGDAPCHSIATDGRVAVIVLRPPTDALASPAVRTAETPSPDGEPSPRP